MEANACLDYMHMLVSIPPKLSVSQLMGYFYRKISITIWKGKSSLMIFDRYADLDISTETEFCCKGYYVDMVGRNKKATEQYIKNQLQEDIALDQISMKEYFDIFTGESVEKSKKITPLGVV